MVVNPNVRAILAVKSNAARRAVIDLMKQGLPLPVALAFLAATHAARQVAEGDSGGKVPG